MIKFNKERAKLLREMKGYTQSYVATKLDCHKSAYGHMERGFRQPSIDKLGKLSEIYGVSTDELLMKKLT
ncbi:helix-turn-helix domain-containing protein [Bacillus sp. C30]|uniref:helix-turn-helix domain-containing protein n=1 Tax=Bacillus sp. C30 TaxID=1387733 RepID=UPI00349F1495